MKTLPTPSVAADSAPQRLLDQCSLIEFPIVHDPRGNLTFIEQHRHCPFEIRRVYYLYDVPGGAVRGGHAHKTLHQIIIAVTGSFDVILDDGRSHKRVHLNRSHWGLHVQPMVWREMDNFSSGSVCLVLASDYFDESDYYRDFSAFKHACREPAP